jgi:hypothetical protein
MFHRRWIEMASGGHEVRRVALADGVDVECVRARRRTLDIQLHQHAGWRFPQRGFAEDLALGVFQGGLRPGSGCGRLGRRVRGRQAHHYWDERELVHATELIAG